MPKQYTDSNGNRFEMDNQLGRGGEAFVYGVLGSPTLVAKIYYKGTKSDSEFQNFLIKSKRKLTAMLSVPPTEPDPNHLSIAWPKELLFEAGQYVGYLMPRIDTKTCETLYNYFYPKARRSRHPQFTRKHAINAACNLASAINLVHSLGHVIGDMNHANILCRDNGLITLIDTDSFSIKDKNGTEFPCDVGMDEYIAPEIQGMTRGKFSWNPAHDLFALGIHVFQLIIGCNPFDAILRGGKAAPLVHTHLIKQRVFPYVKNSVADPRKDRAELFNSLSPTLRGAFADCFDKGGHTPAYRLSADAWITLLRAERDSLIQCTNCRDWFEPHNSECTRCRHPRNKAIPHPPIRPVPAQTPVTTIPPPVRYSPPPPTQPSPRPFPKKFVTATVGLGVAAGLMLAAFRQSPTNAAGRSGTETAETGSAPTSPQALPHSFSRNPTNKVLQSPPAVAIPNFSSVEMQEAILQQPARAALNEVQKQTKFIVACHQNIAELATLSKEQSSLPDHLVNAESIADFGGAIIANRKKITDSIESYFKQLHEMAASPDSVRQSFRSELQRMVRTNDPVWKIVFDDYAFILAGKHPESKSVSENFRLIALARK